MTDRPVDVGRAVRLTLITGLGGLVAALLAVVVGLSVDSATAGILARAVLITALLAIAPRIALATCPRAVALPTAALGLSAGHLLTLNWINGQVYVWRLVTDSALLSAGLDLLTWLAVGLGVTYMVSTRRDRYP